jgi:hypothetical protein
LLLIIAGYFAREAPISIPGPRNVRFGIADFPRFSSLCGTFRTWLAGLTMSVAGGKADLATTNADFRK